MSGITAFHAFAHDLRHYLRLIVGQCEVASKDDSQNLAAKDAFQRILAAGVNCDALVRAMIALEDADATRLMPLPVANLVQGVVFETCASIEGVGGALTTAGEGPNLRVPGAIREVLIELLSNSAKFFESSRPLHVSISWVVRPGEVCLQVLDNGIGIPEQHREKLFAPFFRLHRRDQYPGFGLGLARARKLARQLNGDVTCLAPAEPGALFQILVPLTIPKALDFDEAGGPL